MSNTTRFAMSEFEAAGWVTTNEGKEEWSDEMQMHLCKGVIRLLEAFSTEGHSGSSAPYAVRLFEKLAMFEPITPITGADSEWNHTSDGVYQNKRCSHVFKQADRFNGQAYDIEGIIFREPSGCCYTGSESCVPITFPYTPVRTYKDVPEDKE
jgi:hypothetical protein